MTIEELTSEELLEEYRKNALSYAKMFTKNKITFDGLRDKVLCQTQLKGSPRFCWHKVFNGSEDEKEALRERLERGQCIIDDSRLLFAYLFFNAPKIMDKLARVYASLDAKESLTDLVDGDYALIDWACGQGLGSMALFDFIESQAFGGRKRPLPRETILIEPSELALDNAAFHLDLYGIKEPKKIAKRIAESEIAYDDLRVKQPRTLHILSHIVDMLEDADLQYLANLIVHSSTGEHYVFCVSPTHSSHDVPENLQKMRSYLDKAVNDDGLGRTFDILVTSEDVVSADDEDGMEFFIGKIS